MKSFIKILTNVTLVALVAVLIYFVWGNYSTINPPDVVESHDPNWTPPPLDYTPSPSPSETPRPQAANGTRMTLAIAGDMIMHSGLHDEAKQEDGSYNYYNVFGGAADYLKNADFAVTNLEAALIEGPEYTGYPEFGSPDGLAGSMREIGIDLVNLANNHILNYGKDGLDRTIDVFQENGIAKVGAYKTQEERDESSGITRATSNDISMAFLSYTYATNGNPVDRPPNQHYPYAVNIFFEDYMSEVAEMKEIKYDMIAKDMAAAREMETDLIIVYMHWGYENETTPSAYQYELADFLFSEGADIIIGGHPYVPQPMELRTVIDNEGKEKTGFICYNLGNFVSCQPQEWADLTAIAEIDIEKDYDTDETYILGVRYHPMFMLDTNKYEIETGFRYRLWDIRGVLDSYDSGDDLGVVTSELYEDLKKGLKEIQSIFGEEYEARYQAG